MDTSGRFAIDLTEPVTTSICFSCPCAVKPMDRPLGDQNGYVAPSVPARARAVPFASDCTHMLGRPSRGPATHATCRPSADTAGMPFGVSTPDGKSIAKIVASAAHAGNAAVDRLRVVTTSVTAATA